MLASNSQDNDSVCQNSMFLLLNSKKLHL